jgi:hypothetical protein
MSFDSDNDSRPRLFLSYSRKDLGFVERLANDLDSRGCLCDYDVVGTDPDNVLLGISPEDDWWRRLQEMLTRAHVVVFVLSPQSLRSKVCDEEVAFALSNGKRVIPVTFGAVDVAILPPRLSALNVAIHFGNGEDSQYGQALTKLARVAQLDVAWNRTAADVSIAAHRWNAHGRGQEALVLGSELQALQRWASTRPAAAPPHSELVLAYLTACQQAEDDRVAMLEAERERYLELIEVVRPMLEAEIRVREAQPPSIHPGIRREQEVELERVRSLLGSRWHPSAAKHVASTGATEGYAEIFVFPCCNKIVRDFLSTGEGDPPLQFRSDGCRDIPPSLQHSQRRRSNPFQPLIVSQRPDTGPSEKDA